MKTIYFCNQIISTDYAGEIDALATDSFFAVIFAAYTIFIWDLGGGFLSSVTGLISLVFFARVIYLAMEWFNGARASVSHPSSTVPADADQAARKQAPGQSAKKKKFKSRMFKMV